MRFWRRGRRSGSPSRKPWPPVPQRGVEEAHEGVGLLRQAPARSQARGRRPGEEDEGLIVEVDARVDDAAPQVAARARSARLAGRSPCDGAQAQVHGLGGARDTRPRRVTERVDLARGDPQPAESASQVRVAGSRCS